MTTEKTLRDPSEKLTRSELDILSAQLDDAIKSKEEDGTLTFSSDPMEPKPTTIDLSRFGLHNPDDIKIFLLSPEGKRVKYEIASELILEEVMKEEQQLQIQEELLMQERRRGLLFHLLMQEKEEAKKARDELLLMQQEKLLNDLSPHDTPAPTSTKPKTSSYDQLLADMRRNHRALHEQFNQLEQDRKLINQKYAGHEAGLKEIEHLEDSSEEELNKEIEKLKLEANSLEDKISQGADKRANHRLEHKLETIKLKIASLEQMRAKHKDEHVFADAEGNTEGVKYKDAAFVHSKHQMIRKDKDGQHYLLEKGQKLENMSDDEKVQAKHKFESSKHQLKAVRHRVRDSYKHELDTNESQMAAVKAEQLMLLRQMALVSQAARANSLSAKNMPHLQMQSPQSTKTPGHFLRDIPSPTSAQPQSPKPDLSPKPTPPMFSASVMAKSLGNEPKPMTWGSLFSFVKTIPSPQAQQEADEFLTDEIQKKLPQDKRDKLDLDKPETLKERIKEMLKMTPVPETTMQVFLQHMSEFEEAYKPNVTAERSPLQLKEDVAKEPTPLDTTPSISS